MEYDSYARAKDFILSNARLLERTIFAVLFENESNSRILRIIASYQNDDGGLGHALEPDLRCSESQPLFVEVGLSALQECGCRDSQFANSLCIFLESVSDEGGLVPPILRTAIAAPHATHWRESNINFDLNPTIGICGLLHYQGATHPWLEKATRTCIDIMLSDPPREAHTLSGATRLADFHPDPEIRDRLFQIVADSLPGAQFFIPHVPVRTYGLTPLHFAVTPASRWRQLFTDYQIDGHLEELKNSQKEDGGWPITWEAPSQASVSEWRGKGTLEALKVLAAYQRIPCPSTG